MARFYQKALEEFRAKEPGYFQEFPYGSFMDAVRALARVDPIQPWFHQEVGLAGYKPAQIYIVNGEVDGISFEDIKAAKGRPGANLHTHPIGSANSSFPSIDDFKHLANGSYGSSFILSRSRKERYNITKYGIKARFDAFDGGICIWPENEDGLEIYVDRFVEPYEICTVSIKPVRSESGVIRALRWDDKPVFDVLPLSIVEQLHSQHGDDVFYNPEIDWYEEGKKIALASSMRKDQSSLQHGKAYI